MIELLKMILVLGAGIGIGYLLARTKTMSDYNYMYSHLTCQIVSRMADAMRSMCVDQDMIDRVIKRMGCKIMPPACPRPPKPTEKKKSLSELGNEIGDKRLEQWKPSDNELEVLRLAAEKDGTCLMGLYEQLKKLREE